MEEVDEFYGAITGDNQKSIDMSYKWVYSNKDVVNDLIEDTRFDHIPVELKCAVITASSHDPDRMDVGDKMEDIRWELSDKDIPSDVIVRIIERMEGGD